jgi:hypothetical protein
LVKREVTKLSIFFILHVKTIIFMHPTDPKSCNNLQQAVNAYEPPEIEILEISVEKGFADSATDWGSGTWPMSG